MPTNCPCGSALLFTDCCRPYITGAAKAPTADALMRSRYSAYAVHAAQYLYDTTAPKERRHTSVADILGWATANQWLKLEVLHATETTVEFKAYYLDGQLRAQVHHERSRFVKIDGAWFYLDDKAPSLKK